MSDFRTTLYERYVSDFKGRGRQPGESSSAWRAHTYGPLFEDLDSKSAILELGCGSGQMLQFLRTRGFRSVRGIDISQEQVQLATDAGCNAEMADGLAYLHDRRRTFDAIVALDFVEHFHKDELIELANGLFHALKPGAKLILQTPNGEGLFARQIIFGDMTHLTIFTPNSLRQLLQRAGFDDFRFYETGPIPKGPIGLARTVLWKGLRGLANAVRRIETGKSQSIWTENMICVCQRPR